MCVWCIQDEDLPYGSRQEKTPPATSPAKNIDASSEGQVEQLSTPRSACGDSPAGLEPDLLLRLHQLRAAHEALEGGGSTSAAAPGAAAANQLQKQQPSNCSRMHMAASATASSSANATAPAAANSGGRQMLDNPVVQTVAKGVRLKAQT